MEDLKKDQFIFSYEDCLLPRASAEVNCCVCQQIVASLFYGTSTIKNTWICSCGRKSEIMNTQTG